MYFNKFVNTRNLLPSASDLIRQLFCTFPTCNVPTGPNSKAAGLGICYLQHKTRNNHRHYNHRHYQDDSRELKKWDRPSSFLDARYSDKNIITPREVTQAGLPKLGPSDRLILGANGGISKASDKMRV